MTSKRDNNGKHHRIVHSSQDSHLSSLPGDGRGGGGGVGGGVGCGCGLR